MEESKQPPQDWEKLNPEEKQKIISGLSQLYNKHSLPDAKLETQQQIGISLIKGRHSIEEFLVSENNFPMKCENDLEAFTIEANTFLEGKVDISTAMLMNQCILKKGDKLESIDNLRLIMDKENNGMESLVLQDQNTYILLWDQEINKIMEFLIGFKMHVRDIGDKDTKIALILYKTDQRCIEKEILQLLDDIQIYDGTKSALPSELSISSYSSKDKPFIILVNKSSDIMFSRPSAKINKAKKLIEANFEQSKINEIESSIWIKESYSSFSPDGEPSFDKEFGLTLGEMETFWEKDKELTKVLKGFLWKGVIALNLKQLNCQTGLTEYKAKFIINIKGKEFFAKKVKASLEQVIKAHQQPGIYFKLNYLELPTINFNLSASMCHYCSGPLEATIYQTCSLDSPNTACLKCATELPEPFIVISSDHYLENNYPLKVYQSEDQKDAALCDICEKQIVGEKYHCCYCLDYDLCGKCYRENEKIGEQKDDELHEKGRHAMVWFKSENFFAKI